MGFIKAATRQGFSQVFLLSSAHIYFSMKVLCSLRNSLIVYPCLKEQLKTLKPSDRRSSLLGVRSSYLSVQSWRWKWLLGTHCPANQFRTFALPCPAERGIENSASGSRPAGRELDQKCKISGLRVRASSLVSCTPADGNYPLPSRHNNMLGVPLTLHVISLFVSSESVRRLVGSTGESVAVAVAVAACGGEGAGGSGVTPDHHPLH